MTFGKTVTTELNQARVNRYDQYLMFTVISRTFLANFHLFKMEEKRIVGNVKAMVVSMLYYLTLLMKVD